MYHSHHYWPGPAVTNSLFLIGHKVGSSEMIPLHKTLKKTCSLWEAENILLKSATHSEHLERTRQCCKLDPKKQACLLSLHPLLSAVDSTAILRLTLLRKGCLKMAD